MTWPIRGRRRTATRSSGTAGERLRAEKGTAKASSALTFVRWAAHFLLHASFVLLRVRGAPYGLGFASRRGRIGTVRGSGCHRQPPLFFYWALVSRAGICLRGDRHARSVSPRPLLQHLPLEFDAARP